MALTTLPVPWAYPGYLRTTGSIILGTDATLDAAGEYFAYIFCASENMTIAHVGFRPGTVSGSPTASIRVETVGGDGLPSGTLWAANTSATTATVVTSTWIGTNLTASATVTKGQLFCIKIGYNTGTTLTITRVSALNNQIYSLPYQVINTGTPTKQRVSGVGILGVGSSSTAFYPLLGVLPLSTISSASFNNTNGARQGLRFRIPFMARACGIRVQGFSSSGDFNIAIYDLEGNEVTSSSTAVDASQNAESQSGVNTWYFDSPAIIKPDTLYRAVLVPTSTTNISFATLVFPSDDHRSGSYAGTNNLLTTYVTDSWTDTATETIPLLDVMFDQVDLGVPGMAPGIQPMERGLIQRDAAFF